MGQIEVAVPRTRESGSACDTLGRYQRRVAEVDDLVAEAYVSGVSTRKMGAVTEALLGERVGRSTVSRVTKRLEDEVEALGTTPIAEPIRYLYLDATFRDARWARTVENVAVLIAYGVGADGKRRLLGVTIGPEESEASWAELLEQLVARGLSGVELVIADEHAGLVKAVRRLLPEAKRQRCVVHLERTVLTKTPARRRARLARQVAAIFQARARPRPPSAWRPSRPRSARRSPRRSHASSRASRPRPSAMPSRRPTGCACGPRTGSSGCTARSSGASVRWARSPIAPARCASSSRSRCASPRSGTTAGTWTSRPAERRRARRSRRREAQSRGASYVRILHRERDLTVARPPHRALAAAIIAPSSPPGAYS
jgi:Transposase, Mutator family